MVPAPRTVGRVGVGAIGRGRGTTVCRVHYLVRDPMRAGRLGGEVGTDVTEIGDCRSPG
jgi:hypothetical protein